MSLRFAASATAAKPIVDAVPVGDSASPSEGHSFYRDRQAGRPQAAAVAEPGAPVAPMKNRRKKTVSVSIELCYWSLRVAFPAGPSYTSSTV